MESKITSTQHEHSLTIQRDDGTKVEFVCDSKDEIAICELNCITDEWKTILLSMDEAQKLLEYLQSLLGDEPKTYQTRADWSKLQKEL